MQSNFWAGSKNLDRHKTFCDLQKDKALEVLNVKKWGDVGPDCTG